MSSTALSPRALLLALAVVMVWGSNFAIIGATLIRIIDNPHFHAGHGAPTFGLPDECLFGSSVARRK